MALGIDERTSQPASRRRPVRSLDPVAGAPAERPRFVRFAAAMAAARAANAPQVVLGRDPPEYDVPPAASHVLPRPRAAQWRAPRRPVAPWLGIATSVLLLSLLLAVVPMPPIGAEIERLIGWLEWQQDPEVAAPQADQAPPAMPEPAAGRGEPPPGSMPMLADESSGVAAGSDPAVPDGGVAAPASEELPAARSVPVPTLKPPLTDR